MSMQIPYFNVAWRHLVKNKVAGSLNIVGLAIGIAACIMAAMFITDELSFDRYHSSAEKIFRFTSDQVSYDGSVAPTAVTPPAIANVLTNNISQVDAVTRIFPGWGNRFFIRK